MGFVIGFIGCSLLTNLFMDVGISLWGQLGIAGWALEFIMALSYDEGTSFISKLLSSKAMLFLGRISYALYLVHEVLIQYLCWINYGSIEEPNCECEDGENTSCCDAEDEY